MTMNNETVVIILCILIVISIAVNGFLLFRTVPKYKNTTNGSSDYVSKKKHKEILDKNNKLEKEKKELLNKLNRTSQDNISFIRIDDLERTIKKLNYEISELTRENNELKKMVAEPSSDSNSVSRESYDDKDSYYSSKPTTSESWQFHEVSKCVSSEYVTMYASMARQVDNRAYFSDISDNIKDDSYFVLTIHKSSETATYKPLDFMKIRGYDPVMSAIRTEGAKPHAATAVLSIEPGEAHLEGKDWFIDKYTTIKLA